MGEKIPMLALILAYWLHMLATVFWLGNLSTILFVVTPLARQMLPGKYSRLFVEKMQTRLQQVGWLSLLFLVVTGMFQMSSHPEYKGFLAIDNQWSLAILLKHITVGALIVSSAYITWILNPKLQHIGLRRTTGIEVHSIESRQLEKIQNYIFWLNLAISLVVLGLTAWARSS
jgi:uncharacterized membrane protein